MNPIERLWRFPSVLMAWRNLGRNRVRTGLAALGIAIGVIAIASLGMAGAAIQYQATQDLGSLTNEVTVTTGEDNLEDGLTDAQVREIETVVAGQAVIPRKSSDTILEANGEGARVSVTGVERADALYDAEEGEVPDRLTAGALVSADVADELGLEIGDPISYDGRLYRIRGILESEQGFGPGGGGQVVVPIDALREEEYYTSVTVLAEDGETAQRLAETIETQINDRGEEMVSATTPASIQESVDSFLNTLNLALLGIGSISLVVASVAILNVMLMSTIERRGEIGVLRAVGIRRGEVLRMILAESVFLGVIGGAVGVVVSFGVGLVLNHVLLEDATLVLEWNAFRYLVYGFGFAIVASLLSGFYPAWKAANERPVELLRD
ncbi:ABC transporter permease [Halopenitus salinus]|uniref:ABC transporter permease n=1 Tax=Halopenitus salinus TaxID=1198295 RepID=A0ABD5UVB5_9EURY